MATKRDLRAEDTSAGVTRRAVLGAGALIAAAAAGCSTTSRPAPAPTSSDVAIPPSALTTTAADAPPAQPSVTLSTPATSTPTEAPSSAHPSRASAREIGRATSTRPQVALTFHGAGDPALAARILAILQAHGSHVTVLAVGTWLAQYPHVAHNILDAGHELGNHTWTHPTLSDLGRRAVQLEITRCRDELRRLTGTPGRYFRQSGSQHSTPLIRRIAGQAGYGVCLSYDVDSLDWTDPGVTAVRRHTATATAGSIVSMHLGHPGTAAALPGVLTDLHARGLHSVTATELLRP